MYQQFFGLRALPFSIAPDPEYLYLSSQHREALAHLLYGVGSSGGFVLLTGEVGTGKTTVCRCLLQQMPQKTELAYIVNPRQTPVELLGSICDELKISTEPGRDSIKYYTDRLLQYLIEANRRGFRTLLLIDEAQNLGVDVLEQIRLLTNLETNDRKLLQLVLLGQPELNDLLARSDLRQLAQRITARYHLGPLDLRDARAYIKHRLAVAGVFGELFPGWATRRIWRASGGVPRLINVICDRILLAVYAENASTVRRVHVRRAIREVLAPAPKSITRWVKLRRLAAGLLVVGAAIAVWQQGATGLGDMVSDARALYATLSRTAPASSRPYSAGSGMSN
jgi:general secretion pathway protein A